MRILLLAGLFLTGIATHPPVHPAAGTPASLAIEDGHDLEGKVRSFLEAFINGENTAEEQLAFFADRVHYYEQGLVSRNAIARDVAYTLNRWPRRDNRLTEIEYLEPIPNEDKIFVSYVVDYEVSNANRTVRGTARYGAVIGSLADRPRIEGIFENVTSRRRLPAAR